MRLVVPLPHTSGCCMAVCTSHTSGCCMCTMLDYPGCMCTMLDYPGGVCTPLSIPGWCMYPSQHTRVGISRSGTRVGISRSGTRVVTVLSCTRVVTVLSCTRGIMVGIVLPVHHGGYSLPCASWWVYTSWYTGLCTHPGYTMVHTSVLHPRVYLQQVCGLCGNEALGSPLGIIRESGRAESLWSSKV